MRNTLGWPRSGTVRRSRPAAASTRAANGAWTWSLKTALLASKKSFVALLQVLEERQALVRHPGELGRHLSPFWCCSCRAGPPAPP